MTYSEALALVAPFITAENAATYAQETDKMLWVEDNIMSSAGVHASICSAFGEAVCEWIEVALDLEADAGVAQ